MRIAFIGNIGWRLDASGNLTAFDSSGNVQAKFIGGIFSSKSNSGTPVTSGQLSSTTTVSGVYVGVGATITPVASGRVLAFGVFTTFTSVAMNLAFGVEQGTAGVHAGNTAKVVTQAARADSIAAGAGNTTAVPSLATGLTNGTAYTFELSIGSNAAGTINFSIGLTYVIAFEI